MVKPSLKFKLNNLMFHKLLQQNQIFQGLQYELHTLLQVIQIEFHSPETELVREFDRTASKQILILGAGICNRFKYYDARKKIDLGVMQLGELACYTHILFDSQPNETIETQTYCTLGAISHKKFNDICTECPDLKQLMLDRIMNNPFDYEREWFVKVCQKRIKYFRQIDQKIL